MTAREEREFRKISKKLAEVEARSKLLDDMKKKRVCLADVECLIQKISNKFQTLWSKRGIMTKHQEELVSLSLKIAIKDINLRGTQLRKKKNWLRGRLETALGPRSEELSAICLK